MLRCMEEKTLDNKPKPFQICFFTQEGKRVELPAAERCALPSNQRAHPYMVGVRPLLRDKHAYSVHSRLITVFNRKSVSQ